MSGYKYSEFSLEREREEKMRLLEDLKNSKSQITGLLEKAHEGLKSTFIKEIENANIWLRKCESIEEQKIALSDLKSLSKEGEATLSTLIETFTQKADKMEKTLNYKLSHLEGLYSGNKTLLNTWFEKEDLIKCENALKEAKHYLETKRLGDLSQCLETTEILLKNNINLAQENEYKHQKRLYVLKALRQVSAEMGFEEIAAPRYEREADKRSRVIYEVDTLDQGKIVFYLSLDNISTHSEISEERCLSEFDKLSQYLEQEFGVKTKFRAEGEKQPEKLIQKGERDFPEEGITLEKA